MGVHNTRLMYNMTSSQQHRACVALGVVSECYIKIMLHYLLTAEVAAFSGTLCEQALWHLCMFLNFVWH